MNKKKIAWHKLWKNYDATKVNCGFLLSLSLLYFYRKKIQVNIRFRVDNLIRNCKIVLKFSISSTKRIQVTLQQSEIIENLESNLQEEVCDSSNLTWWQQMNMLHSCTRKTCEILILKLESNEPEPRFSSTQMSRSFVNSKRA